MLNKINEFRKKLDELEEEIKGKAANEVEKFGDEYWIVNSCGKAERSKWDGGRVDLYRKRAGNIYRTEAEAETALYNQETGFLLKELAERLNDGKVVGLSNEGDSYYYIWYDFRYGTLHDADTNSRKTNSVFCIYGNFFKKALNEIGEDRLIQYFKSL